MKYCVLCGKETNVITREHVPPKAFYLPGHPDLITVPCCQPCNQMKSKDDEYCRQILLMSSLMDYRPQFQPLVDAAVRALDKPRKIGFRRMVDNNSFTRVDYLNNEETMAIEFDEKRLMKWAGQLAVCLAARDYQRTYDLERSKTIYVNSIHGIDHDLDDLVKMTVAFTRSNVGNKVGQGEFCYWGISELRCDVVVQLFYEEFYFVSILYENAPNQALRGSS